MTEIQRWGDKPPEDRPHRRRYRVDYDLVYDNGSQEFTRYYATKLGARIQVWLNMHLYSWGGEAVLIDTERR